MTEYGLPLGQLIISCVKFADDIVLLVRNQRSLCKLMEVTRKLLQRLKLEISVSKSKVMVYDATTGETRFNCADMEPICLEKVIAFKYLGVTVDCSAYNFTRTFNNLVKKKALKYLYRVLSLVKSGQDRSDLAHALWTEVALPSILYGSEVNLEALGNLFSYCKISDNSFTQEDNGPVGKM